MSATASSRASTYRVIALCVLLAAGCLFVWNAMRRRPDVAPEAGRPAGPHPAFANLVGRNRCAECHAEQAAAHAQNGHSHTLARSKDSPAAMSLCGASIPAADGYGQFDYACDDEGLLVSVRDKFGDKQFPIDFAFGSGAHAVTFVTLTQALDAEDGVLGVEHRRTWFRSTGQTVITPGQEHWTPEREIEFFGKSFQGDLLRRCISCHTTNYRLVGDQLEDLVMGVQCEACHGPGAEHAAAAEAKDQQRTLETIFRVQSPADELQLCGKCHRLPDDITPERLERYPPSVTRFQPIGLMQSQCYLQSNGRLGCLNCHDAHAPAASRTLDQHNAVCRDCHQESRDATCSAGHADRCVDCHMRRMELVPGVFFRDHWIRTRPPEPTAADSQDDVTASGEPAAP